MIDGVESFVDDAGLIPKINHKTALHQNSLVNLGSTSDKANVMSESKISFNSCLCTETQLPLYTTFLHPSIHFLLLSHSRNRIKAYTDSKNTSFISIKMLSCCCLLYVPLAHCVTLPLLICAGLITDLCLDIPQ